MLNVLQVPIPTSRDDAEVERQFRDAMKAEWTKSVPVNPACSLSVLIVLLSAEGHRPIDDRASERLDSGEYLNPSVRQ
jgi:hypothetical protein